VILTEVAGLLAFPSLLPGFARVSFESFATPWPVRQPWTNNLSIIMIPSRKTRSTCLEKASLFGHKLARILPRLLAQSTAGWDFGFVKKPLCTGKFRSDGLGQPKKRLSKRWRLGLVFVLRRYRRSTRILAHLDMLRLGQFMAPSQ
jgi:hypothetical protein